MRLRVGPGRIALAVACLLSHAAGCSRKSLSNSVNSERAANTSSVDSAARSAVIIANDSPRAAATAPIAPDTARGIVRRYGAEPLSRLALAPRDGSGAPLLALSGAQMTELAAAEGVEIMVTGHRTNERAADVAPGGAVVFRVQWFVVRAVDGMEARDGVLVVVNGHPFLESASGVRKPIIGLPTALESQTGARIFLVGPPDRAPQAFGVLRRP